MPGTEAQRETTNLLARATRAARDGDFEQAIDLLKGLIQQQPNHEIGLGMLGGIYAQIGMHERAITAFRHILTGNSDNTLARLQLGLAQLSTQQLREALETLKPLLARDDDFAAHYYSGVAHTALGEAGLGRPLLETAAARMPKNHALYPQLQQLLADTAH